MYQRKSNGLWCEKVNGKVITAKTKKALIAKLMDYNEKETNGLKVSEALEEWLTSKEGKVSFKTLEGYAAPIARLNDAFGDVRLKDLTPAMIQGFVNSLHSQGYKRTTVQRPLDILRMMFDYEIVKSGKISTNPCASVKLPRGLKQEHRELASKEDVDIVKASVNLPFGLFAYLLCYTGLRKGEALALTYSDFDFDREIITINKSLSWQHNRPVIKEPKTATSIRRIALLDALGSVLPKKWNGYLFSADNGKTPLTQTEFRHRWVAYCKAAGLCDDAPRITPHQLRHEFATILFDAGVDPADAKDWLGHASESTTREIYTHIRESRKTLTAMQVENFLKGVPTTVPSTKNH
ncbi:MAG: tyrosine-type recombinase/integrase [Bacillota bacterium]|nr:tyrosine-type recombinase/integrase [Bacillota bacterium]